MPLTTQIVRNGSLVPVRWGDFHIAAMAIASILDSTEPKFSKLTAKLLEGDRIYDHTSRIGISGSDSFALALYGALSETPFNFWSIVTLRMDYHFVNKMDGEQFSLLAGDELHMFRS